MPEPLLRKTTIGYALSSAIQDLIDDGQITSPELCEKIMEQFDTSITTAIETNAAYVKYKFKGKATSIKRVDDVFLMVLEKVSIKERQYSSWMELPVVLKLVAQKTPLKKKPNIS